MSDITEMVRQLEEGSEEEQCEAAESLAQCGEPMGEAAIPLLSTLGAEDIELNEWVMAALEELGAPDADDLPMIIAFLQQPGDAGYWAATLIGRMGEDGAMAVPHLRDALQSQADRIVRQRIVWALGKIGPAARPAREQLNQLAEESDMRMSRLAQASLAEITGEG